MSKPSRTPLLAALTILFLAAPLAAWWPPAAQADQGTQKAPKVPKVRSIQVIVENGYHPDRIDIVQGERVRLEFVRREQSGCTREVVFPALEIRKELPHDKPVIIELPALKPGEYQFQCGMNMIRGTLVVRARK